MWARKRIDIKFSDLFRAIGHCLLPARPKGSRRRIADCFDSDQSFVCLSVRSGFDLLLKTVDWPSHSEIIFSGLTINDMPRIASAHGLNVVGADVDWKSLSPSAAEIESKINSNTRAIVVAHLMGGRCEMRKLAELARRYNLLLIEDCAQAYLGNHYTGFPDADVSMFSFGSIKTNTALGGGIFFVRDPILKSKLVANHKKWPIQSNFGFLKRVFKYGLVKIVSSWPAAALIRLGFRAIGSNHDVLAGSLAKGFAGIGFFDRIRQQPSPSLISFLAHRLEKFDPYVIGVRSSRGYRLCSIISRANHELMPIGFQSIEPTHWVFAILVENPHELVRKLWDNGFDATTRSSLVPVAEFPEPRRDNVIENTVESPHYRLPETRMIDRALVFLPLDLPMPDDEITRLGRAVTKYGRSIAEFAVPPTPVIDGCMQESSDASS